MRKATLRTLLMAVIPTALLLILFTWIDFARGQHFDIWLLLFSGALSAIALTLYLSEPRAPWVRRGPKHIGPVTIVWRRK